MFREGSSCPCTACHIGPQWLVPRTGHKGSAVLCCSLPASVACLLGTACRSPASLPLHPPTLLTFTAVESLVFQERLLPCSLSLAVGLRLFRVRVLTCRLMMTESFHFCKYLKCRREIWASRCPASHLLFACRLRNPFRLKNDPAVRSFFEVNTARSTGKKKSVGCGGAACSAAYRAPARRQLWGAADVRMCRRGAGGRV